MGTRHRDTNAFDPAKYCAYNISTEITYDPAKNAHNIALRGLSFERAAEFDFATARIWQDTRKHYPEARFVTLGYLDDRLHVLVFGRMARGIRIISLRKANAREGKNHGFTLTRD